MLMLKSLGPFNLPTFLSTNHTNALDFFAPIFQVRDKDTLTALTSVFGNCHHFKTPKTGLKEK